MNTTNEKEPTVALCSRTTISFEAIPTEDGWLLILSGVEPETFAKIPPSYRVAMLIHAQKEYERKWGREEKEEHKRVADEYLKLREDVIHLLGKIANSNYPPEHWFPVSLGKILGGTYERK